MSNEIKKESSSSHFQLIATHTDINDAGQTVRFVEPSIKTTATNKADGSKELDASKSVTIQDKVE
ncbi:VaFE repeat-containing surface-anchored protein, partial [Bacillus mycoides]